MPGVSLSLREEAVLVMDESFWTAHAAVQRFIAQGEPRSTRSAELPTLHLVTRSLSDV
jgi:hypothetical protein